MSTVVCAACSTANAPDSRFCGECGKPLIQKADSSSTTPTPPSATDVFEQADCPQCGYANPAGTESCPECGWQLSEPEPREPAAPSAAAPPATPVSTGTGTADTGTQLFVSSTVLDQGRIQRLLPEGRSETVDFEDEIVIGRVDGDVCVPEDPYLSDRHVRIRREEGAYVVEDLDSVNGTFYRLTEEYELRPGDQIIVGGQVFEFVV